MSVGDKIQRHTLAAELVAAGERLEAAKNEREKHTAAVELLRLRLVYFSGRDPGPFRVVELANVCDELNSAGVMAITDWCWAAYQGGMEHMKDSFDERTKR